MKSLVLITNREIGRSYTDGQVYPSFEAARVAAQLFNCIGYTYSWAEAIPAYGEYA